MAEALNFMTTGLGIISWVAGLWYFFISLVRSSFLSNPVRYSFAESITSITKVCNPPPISETDYTAFQDNYCQRFSSIQRWACSVVKKNIYE